MNLLKWAFTPETEQEKEIRELRQENHELKKELLMLQDALRDTNKTMETIITKHEKNK